MLKIFRRFILPKNEEEFALELASQIIDTKKFKEVQCDKINNEINCDGIKIHTSNIFRDYQNLPKKDQRKFISDLAQIHSWTQEDRDFSYEEAIHSLVPRLRERFHFDALMLYAQKESPQSETVIPYLLLNEHLAVGLTLNSKNSIRYVYKEDLEKWGVYFEDALNASYDNLSVLTDVPFEEAYPGLWVSPWHDSYDPSRLLLLDFIKALTLTGAPIAFLPNRDTLIITGSDDIEGLKKAIQLTLDGLDNHRAATGMPFIIGENTIDLFTPASDHPLHDDLAYLIRSSLLSSYEEQQSLLELIFDDDVVVAECALSAPEGETPCIVSFLQKDCVTYLPEADKVYLLNGDELEQNDEVFMSKLVVFEKFRQVCEHRLEPINIYPKRYLVKTFPSKQELKKLGVL